MHIVNLGYFVDAIFYILYSIWQTKLYRQHTKLEFLNILTSIPFAPFSYFFQNLNIINTTTSCFYLDFNWKKMKALIVLAFLVGAVVSATIDDNEVSTLFINELYKKL